ncbi:MAG: hypothetical protein D6832_07680 [Alphaproteobacteria bacterium]|nr:MAG: hypothetical protein D6832_07680 [Alphaproteobacteria bacterium]
MRRFTSIGALALAAALLLAGCSSDRDVPSAKRAVLAGVKLLATQLRETEADVAARRRAVEALTAEQLLGPGVVPVILIDVEATRNYASLMMVERSATHDTFLSGDAKTITLRRGVLAKTRGFPDDILFSDVEELVAALEARPRTPVEIRHVIRRLDGEDHVTRTVYACVLAPGGVEDVVSVHRRMRLARYDERCRAPDGREFANVYWLGPRGIVRSRQWLGPITGSLTIDVIVPRGWPKVAQRRARD